MLCKRCLAIALSLVSALVALDSAEGAAQGRALDPADFDGLVDERLIAEVRDWLERPVTLISVRAQNTRADTEGVDQVRIDALDREWRAQTDPNATERDLIASTLSSPLSSYLSLVQAQSLGLYSEIFVTDKHGLNVGQSAITSDYWQGDEDKFQKTFLVGPGAVFVDAPEYHEASDTWRQQLNLSVPDPDTGRAIGSATIEINLTELLRRQQSAETD